MKWRFVQIKFAAGFALLGVSLFALTLLRPQTTAQESDKGGLAAKYASEVRPLLKKYCLDCHSTKAKKGSLDLERFASTADVRKDLKHWQALIEQIEAGEMPPKNKPQPSEAEKKNLLAWVRAFLDDEARARAGDPGHVPMRRLSNAEYDNTIRDLTGVDLRPAREFPADGAAGEGFTNAAEALTDVSPALLAKYLNAAKDVADHAVLLPDGFRFSAGKTRRDWTDESTARLRRFYAEVATAAGRLPLQPYLAATVRHREALLAGKVTAADVASKEKLNAKYFGELWRTLTDKTPSPALDPLRARWRAATEKDVPALVAEVAARQAVLWQVAKIGSYMRPVGAGYEVNLSRQHANDPQAVKSLPVRLSIKPEPGESEVVLRLAAHDLVTNKPAGRVTWHRPRFEARGRRPLLLRNYDNFGDSYEVDYPSVFANSAKYLAAVVEAVNDGKANLDDLAKKHGIDAAFLKRWITVLALEPLSKDGDKAGRPVPVVALELLDEKQTGAGNKTAVNGWKRKGIDLPVLVANSSDRAELIPGKISAHGVAVHPTPQEFVAVVWDSPIAASVSVTARITHAHPACGNGVAWWLEHRTGKQALVVAEGVVDKGGESKPGAKTLKVQKGDRIVLAIDARDGNHVCDLTDVGFTIAETDRPNRKWDLAADVAGSVHDGNPHADRHGNKQTWSFVRGPTRPVKGSSNKLVPAGSVLARWREAATDPRRKADATKLAAQVQSLLSGKRPAANRGADRALYDAYVSAAAELFKGIDPAPLSKPRAKDAPPMGLARERFGKHPDNKPVDAADLVADANSVTEVRLPAALLVEREFVVECQPDAESDDRVIQFRIQTAPVGTGAYWDGKSPVVAAPAGAGFKRLLAGHDAFRRVFPLFTCFPNVIPTDEVVCLKMFHREDDPLVRLFLDAEQAKRLAHLWEEHRFISRQAVAENAYLPQFIGFVTQDQPKAMVTFFEGQRPAFKKRAEEFTKQETAAIPKQIDALIEFAGRAYRRPLTDKEKAGLRELYEAIVKKGASPVEAFRGVLTRVLASPMFLFRVEQAPAGKDAAAVTDWELATRLSYFLWSSAPDAELRKLAEGGKLRDAKVLAAQVERMVKDGRTRALAIEFGTQWIHVRGFDEHNEKNEKLFPTFNAELRKAMYEESILFFQDLFQGDRAVTDVLNSDATFLNEALAKHYGIPGVNGPQWRRVTGVRKHGRGGILGLASVQAKQSGASRTSPVLRGNWVVETLLGEKLPRPPADVPQLPQEEKANLTTREMVEKHAKQASCAVCHVRIDPFGFALEKYDPIGRRREKETSGLAVDAKAKLKDGTEFEGIDGLRKYLMTKKKDVIVRLFCRRLLGYALGRAVTLSDTSLLDEMVAELKKNDGKTSAAVWTIVRSKQFRMIRGNEFTE